MIWDVEDFACLGEEPLTRFEPVRRLGGVVLDVNRQEIAGAGLLDKDGAAERHVQTGWVEMRLDVRGYEAALLA